MTRPSSKRSGAPDDAENDKVVGAVHPTRLSSTRNMKRWCHIVFGVFALLTVTSLAARAVAKPLSLEKRFERAQKLHDAGRCKQALPLFEELTAATKSPNARLYVARCLKQVGRIAEAYEQMRATTREAATESRYVATRNAAAAELAIIEPMVGRLLVRLVERPNGLTLKLNDRQIALTALAKPLGVAPGRYTLVAQAAGRSPLTLEGRIGVDQCCLHLENHNAEHWNVEAAAVGRDKGRGCRALRDRHAVRAVPVVFETAAPAWYAALLIDRERRELGEI